LVLFRGAPTARWLAIAVLCGAVAYAPWSAYQHYADPPGNRLLKWQLGGQLAISPEGTIAAIETGYGEAGVGGTLENKERNFGEMVGLPRVPNDFNAGVRSIEEGRWGSALASVRDARFFSLVPFIGVFLLAPLAMFLGRRRARTANEWRFAMTGFVFVLVTCLFWGLLIFGGSEAITSIHIGTLAVPLLAVSACVVGLHSVYPRAAAWLVSLNVAVVLGLYVPSLQPSQDTSYSWSMAALAAASLVVILMLLFGGRLWRPVLRGDRNRQSFWRLGEKRASV
jgi:hypothetical protein